MIYQTDEFTAPENRDDLPDEQPTCFIDVHIYDLPPGTDEPEAIESDPPTPEPVEQESTPSPNEQDLPTPRHTRRRTITILSAVLGFFLVGGVLTLVSLRSILFPAPEATITIVTVSRPIRATMPVTIVTGQTPKMGQIAGRQLAAITMSQQRTIATTGTVHQGAQVAHGLITFYNAATYSQVIPAGMILTGTDGTQIVTEQDATLPAVSYPTLGAMTVAAHSLIAGPAGDITAGDIYGPCCRLNVSAVSRAFTGGQNARSYPTVTAQDISAVAASMSKTMVQSAQAALQTQVSSNETLITPLPCQQQVAPNHQPGSEAAQVTITVSETCTSTVYNTQQYQNVLTHTMDQQATKQLGQGYNMTGAIQSSITSASYHNDTTTLHVTSAVTYVYQMSGQQQQVLAKLVTGKSAAQARNLLLQVPGIQSVAIDTTRTSLPADPGRVHLVFLSVETD